jgi:hypothetical protein
VTAKALQRVAPFADQQNEWNIACEKLLLGSYEAFSARLGPFIVI